MNVAGDGGTDAQERVLGGSDPRQLVRSALTCESV